MRVRARDARDAAACGAACRRGSPAELRVTGALAHMLNVPQARLPLGSPHAVACAFRAAARLRLPCVVHAGIGGRSHVRAQALLQVVRSDGPSTVRIAVVVQNAKVKAARLPLSAAPTLPHSAAVAAAVSTTVVEY